MIELLFVLVVAPLHANAPLRMEPPRISSELQSATTAPPPGVLIGEAEGPEIGGSPPELWWMLATDPTGLAIYHKDQVVWCVHVYKRGTVVRPVRRDYPGKERFLVPGPDGRTYLTTTALFTVFRIDVSNDPEGKSESPRKETLQRWFKDSVYMLTFADTEAAPNIWFEEGSTGKYLDEVRVLIPKLHQSQEPSPP